MIENVCGKGLKAASLALILAPFLLAGAASAPASAAVTQQSHEVTQDQFSTTVSERRGAFDNLQAQMELMPLPYEIGDNGPGGGIVFYVDEAGQSGLEAAPSNQGGAPWDLEPFATANASRDGINAGLFNTQRISIANAAKAQSYGAAVCEDYRGGRLGDWYLPSTTELQHLYDQRDAVDGLDNGPYWSSVESTLYSNQADYVRFTDGEVRPKLKSAPMNIRCIRAL